MDIFQKISDLVQERDEPVECRPSRLGLGATPQQMQESLREEARKKLKKRLKPEQKGKQKTIKKRKQEKVHPMAIN